VDVIHRNALLTGEFRAAVAQGRGQTRAVQQGRIQIAGEMAQVVSQAGHALLKGIRSPWRGHARGQVCRLQGQRGSGRRSVPRPPAGVPLLASRNKRAVRASNSSPWPLAASGRIPNTVSEFLGEQHVAGGTGAVAGRPAGTMLSAKERLGVNQTELRNRAVQHAVDPQGRLKSAFGERAVGTPADFQVVDARPATIRASAGLDGRTGPKLRWSGRSVLRDPARRSVREASRRPPGRVHRAAHGLQADTRTSRGQLTAPFAKRTWATSQSEAQDKQGVSP